MSVRRGFWLSFLPKTGCAIWPGRARGRREGGPEIAIYTPKRSFKGEPALPLLLWLLAWPAMRDINTRWLPSLSPLLPAHLLSSFQESKSGNKFLLQGGGRAGRVAPAEREVESREHSRPLTDGKR